MGVCETLEFKYTVEFSSHKKKLIKKIIISKGTRNSFFIDESRIWNFSTETIDAANTRSYLLNYMTNEHLTKEFWKLSDNVPIRNFSKKILVHKDDFIRFVDKKFNKKGNGVLYSGNVQFETIIQPVFGNRSILYKSIVNYLGIPRYYHDRRDTSFLKYFNFFNIKKIFTLGTNIYHYKKKQDTNRVYISRKDIDWIFLDKYSLKIGASVRDLKINISPKIDDDLRTFLEPSTRLVNIESGQEEFSSVRTKEHFFSRKKGVEEAIEKLNKTGTDFYINKSNFLYDKSSFIEQTFITALNKKYLFMVLLVTSTKKSKNDIIKIIDPEEFLKFYVKKGTLKDS